MVLMIPMCTSHANFIGMAACMSIINQRDLCLLMCTPHHILSTSTFYVHANPGSRGGGHTHLWMCGISASHMMVGMCMLGINTSHETVNFSVSSNTNTPQTIEVPINHLRPYIHSLNGTHWTDDNPSNVSHPFTLACSEPGCSMHATHDNDIPDAP